VDLIPLLSFFLLKGKCRFCDKSISWQYPAVEFLTGTLFLLFFVLRLPELNSFVDFAQAGYFVFIISLFVLILVYDLKHLLIPDEAIEAGLMVSGLWYLTAFLLGAQSLQELAGYIFSSLGASAFLLTLFLVTKGKGMGFGDVKFALLMGLFLGYPKIIAGLFLSFLIGAIIGLVMILLQKKGMKSEIPFAPFLVAGSFVAFFWGEAILQEYYMLFSFF